PGRSPLSLHAALPILPLGPKEPAKRLGVVGRSLTSVAAEPGLAVAEGLAGLISLLPASVLVPALRAQARTVDFAASIVPGLRSRSEEHTSELQSLAYL